LPLDGGLGKEGRCEEGEDQVRDEGFHVLCFEVGDMPYWNTDRTDQTD